MRSSVGWASHTRSLVIFALRSEHLVPERMNKESSGWKEIFQVVQHFGGFCDRTKAVAQHFFSTVFDPQFNHSQ